MSSGYPPQVRRFLGALRRIRGVTRAVAGVESIDRFPVDALGLVDFGHYPHAALRRTRGGLRGEVLVQIELELSRDDDGWRALEFLAWHFRDAARGGSMVQLRPFGLPAVAGESVQLGRSLRFHIDLFVIQKGKGPEAVLQEVDAQASSLGETISLYDAMLRERGDRGVRRRPSKPRRQAR